MGPQSSFAWSLTIWTLLLSSSTITHTETELLSSLTTVPPLENSPMRSTSDRSVSTCQSQCPCQCSVSLVPEARSGAISTFMANKHSSSTPNTRRHPALANRRCHRDYLQRQHATNQNDLCQRS